MNLYNEGLNLEGILTSDLPIEAKVNVLFDVLKNVLDEGAIRARTVRFKLQKYVNSTDINERIYALNVIASDGNGAKVVPTDETAQYGSFPDCTTGRPMRISLPRFRQYPKNRFLFPDDPKIRPCRYSLRSSWLHPARSSECKEQRSD